MPHKALTHRDLSRQLGVSETTVKSYRRKFPGCIPVANQGKPIRFAAEALAVCKRIRDLFELGMNIPEVRARLAAEFPWVSPEVCPACPECGDSEEQGVPAGPPSDSAGAVSDFGQDLSLIVSNLAKSVISLSQQQSALLKRLDGMEVKMEAALQNIVRADAPEARAIPVSPEPSSASAPAPAVRLADKLEGIERTLEQTMGLLGNYVEAVQGLVQASPAAEGQFSAGPGGGNGQDMSEEYLRHLSLLPLAYRNEHGDLAHFGDRSRGSYTLNDLKAVFAQAYQPPDHYAAHWYVEKGQSWFVLEQPENRQGRSIYMLIRLVRVDRGAELAHIAELIIDGVKQPPMTLYPAIQQVLG